MSRTTALGGSLWALRMTWLLWLGSFLVYYALPVLFFTIIEPSPTNIDAVLEPSSPLRIGQAWYWDPELWVPTALAVIVPTAVHRLLARRAGSPYFLVRSSEAATHGYRSCQPWAIATSAPVVRRLAALYAGRMGLAVGLSCVAHGALQRTTFSEMPAMVCRWGDVRSVPEYLFFVSLLLGVALYHIPFTRRILGAPPRITHPRG